MYVCIYTHIYEYRGLQKLLNLLRSNTWGQFTHRYFSNIICSERVLNRIQVMLNSNGRNLGTLRSYTTQAGPATETFVPIVCRLVRSSSNLARPALDEALFLMKNMNTILEFDRLEVAVISNKTWAPEGLEFNISMEKQ